jgi:hypothetical protein
MLGLLSPKRSCPHAGWLGLLRRDLKRLPRQAPRQGLTHRRRHGYQSCGYSGGIALSFGQRQLGGGRRTVASGDRRTRTRGSW